MEKTKPILLKGFHLLHLYSRRFEREDKEMIDMLYGEGTGKKVFDEMNETDIKKYGENHSLALNNLCAYLILHPEQEIAIVDTIDFLCARCSPYMSRLCNPNKSPHDQRIANEYGLKLNYTYKANEIFEKMKIVREKEYKKKAPLFKHLSLLNIKNKLKGPN